MVTHTLYAYVLPSENPSQSAAVLKFVEEFIASHSWRCREAWSVCQPGEDGFEVVGINVALPEPFHEPPGWFSDIEAVISLCVHVRRELGCDFVVGVGDSRSGVAEDIIEIDSENPEVAYLRQFLGTEPPTGKPRK